MKWIGPALAAVMVAGCAQQSQEDVAFMVETATAPTASLRSQIVRDAGAILLSDSSFRDAEISYVGTTAEGLRWVCVRANVGDGWDSDQSREAIAIIGPDGVLIGAQTNCPTCRDPALRWLPFPELEPAAGLSR